MAETPKSCESGASEGAGGNQHSGLTCELHQVLKRHFKVDSHLKVEADQNMELCGALAVKLKLDVDIKREPMVKDPKRGKSTKKLKQLPKKHGKKLRHSNMERS